MAGPLKPLVGPGMGRLEALARRAAEAVSVQSVVQKELPEAVRDHVVSAARRGDELVLIVDSAAWAARVRYAGPRLRERLGELGEPVTRVRVKVRGVESKPVEDRR